LFYITNHHPELPKPSGKQPKHCPWWNSEPTMQEGLHLPELLARIKTLREARLRAEHVAFSFMKRRVQPLMWLATLCGTSTPTTTTRRGCLEMKSTTTTLLIGWPVSSKICRRTRRGPYQSSPPHAHQRRLVAASVVEYSLRESSRTDELLFFLQDDVKKFVSEPASPPQLVEVPEEGKAKAKERREVDEGDDIVVVEDTSDEDDDEGTLQDRFQLRSRFSCPGLPHVPLVQDPPASPEASLPAPPRRSRNAARKRVAKKLKVTETTSQEVSRLE
jgi:hypothetical protein